MSGGICPFTSTNCLLYLQRIDCHLANLTPAPKCRLGLMRWSCVVFKGRLYTEMWLHFTIRDFNFQFRLLDAAYWPDSVFLLATPTTTTTKKSTLINSDPNHDSNNLLHQSQKRCLDVVQPQSGFTANCWSGRFRKKGGRWWWQTEWHAENRSCHVLALTVKTNIFCVCQVRFLISRSNSHYWKPTCDSRAFHKGSSSSVHDFPSGDTVNHTVQSIGMRVLWWTRPSDGPRCVARAQQVTGISICMQKANIDPYYHNKYLCQRPLPPNKPTYPAPISSPASAVQRVIEEQRAARAPKLPRGGV